MRVYTQFQQPIRTVALSLLSCLLAPAAQAQLSGSAGLMSNYLYRGISLSNNQPAARLALNYDGAGGWYAGGQAVTGQLVTEQQRNVQWVGYAGYAARLASGLSWESGVSAYAFPRSPTWNFREVYVGLAGNGLSGRLHYSPDYLGMNERTLFGELNGGWMLAPRWQAFWHGGYLHSFDNALSNRAELRFGVATGLHGWRAQASFDLTRLRSASNSRTYIGTSAIDVDWERRLVLSFARAF
ncbi:TorF family putative porin [Duganella lactea]|uniref:TorF family putative porin n=1 Tax=Duganella lactea TaxID=2692173 RepID=UPI001E4156AE|nr:TorF family putative porin [Duganella lactea]